MREIFDMCVESLGPGDIDQVVNTGSPLDDDRSEHDFLAVDLSFDRRLQSRVARDGEFLFIAQRHIGRTQEKNVGKGL